MIAARALFLAGVILLLPACLATKVVTAPVRVAGDVVEGTAKGVYYVGSTAVHVTGDALDGPEQKVRLKVKVKKSGGRTKTYTKKIENDDIERELKKLSKKGTIIDVQVEPLDD